MTHAPELTPNDAFAFLSSCAAYVPLSQRMTYMASLYVLLEQIMTLRDIQAILIEQGYGW